MVSAAKGIDRHGTRTQPALGGCAPLLLLDSNSPTASNTNFQDDHHDDTQRLSSIVRVAVGEVMSLHPDFDKARLERLDLLSWLDEVDPANKEVIRSRLLRNVSRREIKALQAAANTATDWTRIYLLLEPNSLAGADQSALLASRVTRNNFQGQVILVVQRPGETPQVDGTLPRGLHDNLQIVDSILSLDAAVHRNTSISRTYVAPSATLLHCTHVGCPRPWAQSVTMTVGPEAGGGRHLTLGPEGTMIDVADHLRTTSGSSSSPMVQSSWNVLSSDCEVSDTTTIHGVYLHHGSSIVSASAVTHVVLFEGASIRNSCSVSHAALQWNAAICNHSHVENTLIMEASEAGPQSLVSNAVLGPDVHVSAGEVHASVLGPNTNAHHQSLLIGVLWLLGRGNVGYGANVGSNHTGRLPDQETLSGEGTFWGLSTVIKFPLNLAKSPYTVVAAGATVPPQRLEMPFSLIMSNTSGGNDIVPGWVLKSSPYTVARSEKKFASRRKAKRHHCYTGWTILRPDTIDLCRAARERLLKVNGKSQYTENDIPGIGACVLSERSRVAGIMAYTDAIQLYALQGLLAWLQKEPVPPNDTALRSALSKVPPIRTLDHPSEVLPWKTPYDDEESYRLALVLLEFPVDPEKWLESCLGRLMVLQRDFANRVHRCKARDDERGSTIIPDYADSHIKAGDDPVIKEAMEEADNVEQRVREMLQVIAHPRSRL